MRDHERVLNKKGISTLLRELAEKHPDKYREVSHKLSQIGWRSAQETGGFSFGLEHLRKSKAGKAARQRIQTALSKILSDKTMTAQQREEMIIRHAGRESKRQQQEIYDEARAAGNPLAMQVLSGARGNPMNLASLLGSDVLYTDQRDRIIPIPIDRSYSEGLTPAQYWAGTYGARRGVMATKFATRDAGFLAKQLNQATHRLLVVDEDDKREALTLRGFPVDTDDPDNEGALLAYDVGGYKRNTPLTPKILNNLKRRGVERILVRSPMIGGSPEGGIYARDVGIREKPGLPGRGENVGLAAAQALSEPLSQAQLSAKHSGGVAGEEKAVSGFDYINQLIQVPKKFKGGAAHAQFDGTVTRIEPAPAGGNYVYVNGERHFVGEGYEVKVRKGQKIEAGDVISEGIPNPAEIVRHKGIGEGRRYFTQSFRQSMNEAGLQANRRNVELLSRGLINHVRLTEEFDRFVPDDVVPYATLEHKWKPRKGFRAAPPKEAIGKYLERPYLHYTVGTKITPTMLRDFDRFGVKSVDIHDDEPPFQPEMIRGMYTLQHDPDWMTRMYGSGLKGGLLQATHRGGTSQELGTSFIPSLAKGTEFGRAGLVHAPEMVTKISEDESDERRIYRGELFTGEDLQKVPSPGEIAEGSKAMTESLIPEDDTSLVKDSVDDYSNLYSGVASAYRAPKKPQPQQPFAPPPPSTVQTPMAKLPTAGGQNQYAAAAQQATQNTRAPTTARGAANQAARESSESSGLGKALLMAPVEAAKHMYNNPGQTIKDVATHPALHSGVAQAAALRLAKKRLAAGATNWRPSQAMGGKLLNRMASGPAWWMDWNPASEAQQRQEDYKVLAEAFGRAPTSQEVSRHGTQQMVGNIGGIQNAAVPLAGGALWAGARTPLSLLARLVPAGSWLGKTRFMQRLSTPLKWATGGAAGGGLKGMMKGTASRALPLYVILDALKESYSSRERGREITFENLKRKLGRDPTTAEMDAAFGWGVSSMPAGFQARSEDIERRSANWRTDQGLWEGAKGYGQAAAKNLGNPLQNIYTLPRTAIGILSDSDKRYHQNRAIEEQAKGLQPQLEQQMAARAETAPILERFNKQYSTHQGRMLLQDTQTGKWYKMGPGSEAEGFAPPSVDSAYNYATSSQDADNAAKRVADLAARGQKGDQAAWDALEGAMDHSEKVYQRTLQLEDAAVQAGGIFPSEGFLKRHPEYQGARKPEVGPGGISGEVASAPDVEYAPESQAVDYAPAPVSSGYVDSPYEGDTTGWQ
jgi:hypothetical protein